MLFFPFLNKVMEEKNTDGYSHVLKYTGIFGGVQSLVILIGLVRNKAMAVFLGANGIGFNALLVSVQNFASQCTNLGISFGAIPKLSELYEDQQRRQFRYYLQVVRLWSLIAAVLGFLFCMAISPLLNTVTFTWGNHTLHYAMLGVAAAMIAISSGETVILKSARRLGALARLQVITAVASVVLSVPFYYFFGSSGVLPSIILIAGFSMLATIYYSYHCYPLQLRFSKQHLRDGLGMIRLGLSYVLAAAIGSASEMLIRSFLNVEGNLDEVGLYNTGYMITITYAGMVFSAMETDYFPRLSAVSKDVAATNETVNRQMEVSLLLLSPMLVGLLMMLPVLVPILFSRDFIAVIQMAQVAVLAMYFKVLSMPVAYITLARSRSLSFLFLETSYFVVLVVAIVIGYQWWGVWGTGLAIVVAHVAEWMIVWSYAFWQYQYRSSWMVICYASVQMSIGALAFIVSTLAEGWTYWITEAALTIVSTAYSIYVLRQKTHLWQSLRRKFGRRGKSPWMPQ